MLQPSMYRKECFYMKVAGREPKYIEKYWKIGVGVWRVEFGYDKIIFRDRRRESFSGGGEGAFYNPRLEPSFTESFKRDIRVSH